MKSNRSGIAGCGLKTLVVASLNPHKAAEMHAVFAECRAEFKSLAEYPGYAAPEEDGASYELNAVQKAVAAALHTGEFALGDDSGLEVAALNGRPGLHSARYAPTSAERIAKLLEELRGVPAERRAARFVCAMALADPAGYAVVRRGECPGAIAAAPRGAGGFGYDPVFVPAGSSCTLAELDAAEKNRISHRARAARAMQEVIDQLEAGKQLLELAVNSEHNTVDSG